MPPKRDSAESIGVVFFGCRNLRDTVQLLMHRLFWLIMMAVLAYYLFTARPAWFVNLMSGAPGRRMSLQSLVSLSSAGHAIRLTIQLRSSYGPNELKAGFGG